jgi:hypothetical protein
MSLLYGGHLCSKAVSAKEKALEKAGEVSSILQPTDHGPFQWLPAFSCMRYTEW